MNLQWPAKDPEEVLDYTVNWADRLAAGDTISTSLFTVDGGVTINTQTNDNLTATVWLAGGTLGVTANILNRIVTAAGRTMEETILLPIQAR